MSNFYGFNSTVVTTRFVGGDWDNPVYTLKRGQSQVEMPGSRTGFRMNEWGYPELDDLDGSAVRYATATDSSKSAPMGMENPLMLQKVTHNGKVSFVLSIDVHVRAGDDSIIGFDNIYVVVKGAALPAFSSVAAFNTWHAAATWVNVSTADYPAGSRVLWETFDIDPANGNASANNILGSYGDDKILGNAGHDTILGDRGEDILLGGAGNDRLNGGIDADVLNGEAGADVLIGGTGKDVFVFNTALGASNIDRITDFSAADDVIRLENAVFKGLTAGALRASAFAANLSGLASDGLDRIIYERDTGKLFYDADGTGSKARVQFALIEDHPTLAAADFLVV